MNTKSLCKNIIKKNVVIESIIEKELITIIPPIIPYICNHINRYLLKIVKIYEDIKLYNPNNCFFGNDNTSKCCIFS